MDTSAISLGPQAAAARESSSGAPPVIELDKLSVRLADRDILREITCSFTGRTIGLLGPNGAGKSTLINTLLGFWPIASGSARVFGADIVPKPQKFAR